MSFPIRFAKTMLRSSDCLLLNLLISRKRGQVKWKMWELAEFLLRWLGPGMGFIVVGFCSHQPSYPVWPDELELPRLRVIPTVPHKPCSPWRRCISLVPWFSRACTVPVVWAHTTLLLLRSTRELTPSLCMGQIIYSKPSYSFLTAVTHIPGHH